MLTATQWAYIAGLIDGEGSVNIDQVTKPSGTYYRPSLTITSTTPEIIDWCFALIPNGSRHTNRRVRQNWKEQHRVSWVYKPALHILRHARPYLVLKGPQADIVTLMPLPDRGRWGYTETIHQKQRAAWRELHALEPRKGRPAKEAALDSRSYVV